MLIDGCLHPDLLSILFQLDARVRDTALTKPHVDLSYPGPALAVGLVPDPEQTVISTDESALKMLLHTQDFRQTAMLTSWSGNAPELPRVVRAAHYNQFNVASWHLLRPVGSFHIWISKWLSQVQEMERILLCQEILSKQNLSPFLIVYQALENQSSIHIMAPSFCKDSHWSLISSSAQAGPVVTNESLGEEMQRCVLKNQAKLLIIAERDKGMGSEMCSQETMVL